MIFTLISHPVIRKVCQSTSVVAASLLIIASCSGEVPGVAPSQDSTGSMLVAPGDVLLPEDLWAAAPSGMSLNLLGAPVDENFRPLAGRGSLVPPEFVDEPASTRRFTSDWREISSEAEMRASVNAWLITGGVDAHAMHRTMTFENLFARSTHQFTPAYQMHTPPEDARYLITAIEVGHLAQVRFQRESSAVSAHVAAKIKHFGGDLGGMKSELGVEGRIYALGVSADTDKGVLKRLTEEQFVQEFSANVDDAVPVRVRYTPIRGRELRNGVLAWAKSYKVHVAPGTLSIADDGTWNSTRWVIRLICLKNKIPLRGDDYWTSSKANPARDKDGNIVRNGPDNQTWVELFSRSFDGRLVVDMTTKWVEFRAEVGDEIECSVSLFTEDNPLDSLSSAGTWPVVSTCVSDQMTTVSAIAQRETKYKFSFPFTTEFHEER